MALFIVYTQSPTERGVSDTDCGPFHTHYDMETHEDKGLKPKANALLQNPNMQT